MLAIFEKIRRPAADAADLRQRHSEVAESLPVLEAEVRRQQQRRADGLLSLSDREVEKIEGELALAVRSRDRAIAALDELERRAADAAEAEARAALDGERDAAERTAKAVALRLVREYDSHSAALIKLLSDLEAAESGVSLVNRKLAEAGRGEEALHMVETRAIGAGSCLETTASIRALTSLRPVGRSAGWGEGRRIAETFGLPV